MGDNIQVCFSPTFEVKVNGKTMMTVGEPECFNCQGEHVYKH